MQLTCIDTLGNECTVPAYLPFSMHGFKFAITRVPGSVKPAWRASHIGTGRCLEASTSASRRDARAKAIEFLGRMGKERTAAAVLEADKRNAAARARLKKAVDKG